MARKKSKGKEGAPRESSYARSQRRKAERIIAASGCYSEAFRDEVATALAEAPWRLPMLFRDADRIDSRRETAGREIRAKLQKAGCPIGSPALRRSPKRAFVREAEEIEALLLADYEDRLDADWSERASLISAILYDMSNEAGVDATHPALVKAYLLAIRDAEFGRSDHDRRQLMLGFARVRDLLNGCSRERFEQIQTIVEGTDHEETMRAVYAESGVVYTPPAPAPAAVEADEVTSLRQQLTDLELVPENEAIRFQLETEIFNLETAGGADEEWPDVIGGGECDT